METPGSSEGDPAPYRYHLSFSKPVDTHGPNSSQQVFFDEDSQEFLACSMVGTKLQIRRQSLKSGEQIIETPNAPFFEEVKIFRDLIGIKQSATSLEIRHINGTVLYTQQCKQASSNHINKILGYYWTNNFNFLIITRQGIEFYEITPNQLKIAKHIKAAINWFIYSPQQHILLVSVGSRTSLLKSFLFGENKNNVVELPEFDVLPANSQAVVYASQLVVARIYGLLMCLYTDPKKKELCLFQLATGQKRLSVELHAPGAVAISIVDNLIVAHNIDQQISMIFDIKMRSAQDNNVVHFPVAGPLSISPTGSTGNLYTNWKFHFPSAISDPSQGRAWNLQLNLTALCATLSDRLKLTDFLLRREGTKPLLISILRTAILQNETLATMSNIFYILSKLMARVNQEQAKIKKQCRMGTGRPNTTQIKTLQYWNTYLDGLRSESGEDPLSLAATHKQAKDISKPDGFCDDFVFIENPEKPATNLEDLSDEVMKSDELVYIEQEEFCNQIFMPIHGNPTSYCNNLIPYILEFIRHMKAEPIRIKSCVFELLIDFHHKSARLYMLQQYFLYGLIDDSYHVACQLLALSSNYPPCYQLALDMLRRLGGEELICSLFLAKGQVVPALLLIQKTRNPIHYKVADLLMAASKDPNPSTFHLVYNFFAGRPTNKPEDIKALNKAKLHLQKQRNKAGL